MMKKILLSLFYLSGIIPSLHCHDKAFYEKFLKSFVLHYDFSPEGRYTHEYHPFLLEKTRSSFERFEKFLVQAGFDCVGRTVIMGYQQEGVPSYYSCLTTPALQDEASLNSKRGRVVPAHNIFGFLTGFLLKDANWLQRKWHPGTPLFVEHVLAERVDLFDDYAYIFQKHAFGKDFETILKCRKRVEKSLKAEQPTSVLQELIYFWELAYNGELKSCGQEVLATQDILFSIDYGKHLLASTVPVSKLYVGPDITYPIEVLSFQEEAATEGAQHFVKLFTQTLKPCDGKKTAYVFCSFVDGVGKSTLLGNVINWVTYKDDIASYQRVDNASSQKGVLYPLKEDVFIMDLPAQLSHWIGKPDGQVFVDAASIHELTAEDQRAMDEYVQVHLEQLKAEFESQKKACDQQKRATTPLEMYVQNVLLFKPEREWIPFSYKDYQCIFDEADPSRIRLLVPLEGVHSKGLKTAQPEHMLFTKGLMLPPRFEVFMEDVASQFRTAGVEKLVFVDFLSMYPRSSRENIRVIFLLQQLKKIYQDYFSIDMSLYRSFVNRETELYHLISFFREQFFTSLFLESMGRSLLYSIFTEKSGAELTVLSFDQVTELLRKASATFLETAAPLASELVDKKLDTEHHLLQRYAYDRKYEMFTRFSWEPLCAFSSFLENLFGNQFDHSYFRTLWEGMDAPLFMPSGQMMQKTVSWGKNALSASLLLGAAAEDGIHMLSSGVQVRCLETVPTACRDSVTLSPIFPVLRAHWYVALSNLLESEHVGGGAFTIKEPRYYVPPLSVKQAPGQKIAVVQKQLDLFDGKPPHQFSRDMNLFNNFSYYRDMAWGEFRSIPHCLEWAETETYFGVYAFAYDWDSPTVRKLVDGERDRKLKAGYEDPAVFMVEVAQMFDQQQLWNTFAAGKSFGSVGAPTQTKKIAVNSARGQAIALWVRAIATLEMLVKDQHSYAIARKGVKEDFIATMRLLERVTLPRYFGIYLDKSLFVDYASVQPVIPWELIV